MVTAAVAVPMLVALVAWRPILGAYFFADDFIHLYDLVSQSCPAFLGQVWGGHVIAVPRAIMAALFAVVGPEPRPWFWSVLLTHVACVALLARLLLRSTGDPLVAGASALCWGTLPVLAGTLEWYSVYGQVLLTAILLVVLELLTRPLMSLGRVALLAALLVTGAASFGSGLGIAATAPLVFGVMVPARRRPPGAMALLMALTAGILAAYVILRAMVPDVVPAEWSRTTWDLEAARLGFVLWGQLVAFCMHAVLAAFVPTDVGPTSVTVAAVLLAFVAAGWIAADGARRRTLAGVALWLGAIYGATAFGRLPLVRLLGLSPAAAAAWPRYHYTTSALVAVMLALAVASMRERSAELRRGLGALVAMWAIVRLALLVAHPLVIDRHDDARAEVAGVVMAVHQEVRASPPGALVRIENRPLKAARFHWLFPGWAGLFAIMVPSDVIDGRTLRFVVSPDDWARARVRGGRVATLMQRGEPSGP